MGTTKWTKWTKFQRVGWMTRSTLRVSGSIRTLPWFSRSFAGWVVIILGGDGGLPDRDDRLRGVIHPCCLSQRDGVCSPGRSPFGTEGRDAGPPVVMSPARRHSARGRQDAGPPVVMSPARRRSARGRQDTGPPVVMSPARRRSARGRQDAGPPVVMSPARRHSVRGRQDAGPPVVMSPARRHSNRAAAAGAGAMAKRCWRERAVK